jgi:integrase
MSTRLGHANTAMTMDLYSHVLPAQEAEAAEAIAARVFGT